MSFMSAKDQLSALEIMGHGDYKDRKEYRVDVPTGKSGPWSVSRFTTRFDLAYLRFWRDGRPPGLGTFTRLVHVNRGIVMSDTNPEVDDLRCHMHLLQGNVLVTGLGLGMAVHMLTRIKRWSKHVTSVTVIEIDRDVIKLTARHYTKDKRVKIINADAHEWLPPKGTKFDAAWHDIWDYGGDKEEYTRIRKHYRGYVVAGKQFVWGRRA